ncbi:hypothetical protein KIN20_018466 [Parelaphostrongylus tenuis]|uniref:Uncharacterized protein n=1 Tax=Parelaphostrongylus tenuis TaxID=148309 RepID=A0AAD5QRF7_PARTN|nr:hypothetical protein KIN20_018466 [Parelaphostrongylus tenuis]
MYRTARNVCTRKEWREGLRLPREKREAVLRLCRYDTEFEHKVLMVQYGIKDKEEIGKNKEKLEKRKNEKAAVNKEKMQKTMKEEGIVSKESSEKRRPRKEKWKRCRKK